jgi:[glutamine synthetase] adenylyltransferase / [glutamine synthetase]-adenylyl-L-tyrosine phosphorylase
MIQSVSQYSPEDLQTACSQSPAIQRYLNIVNQYPELLNLIKFTDLPLHTEYACNLTLIRHQIWLNCALATFFTTSTVKDICYYWSEQVDHIINSAWENFDLDKEDLLLFALGKLGAMELNLSSDVDLVIISNDPNSQKSSRKIQAFTKTLTSLNQFGFCLRVDYNLRPGGRFGPLVSSLSQFQDYYWSQGETWEKLALGRFRAINTNLSLKSKLTEVINNFCFRKYIDYTLFDDLKNIRKQIQEHYFKNNQLQQFHLKLGKGGIRDIELYLHALQIIHGGRYPEIRNYSTSQLTENLTSRSLLKEVEGETLINSYWKYRELENKIQIYEDQQTHTWSVDLKYPSLSTLDAKNLLQLSEEIDNVVSDLLGPILSSKNPLPATMEEQVSWLTKHGFKPDIINDVWPKLMELTARSIRGQKDEAIRRNFLYYFVEELRVVNLDFNLGLKLLFDFIKSTHAKASLFSLLVKEKHLLHDLAILFSVSPYLGGIISSRPEILDNYFMNAQAELSSDFETLLDQLTEKKLLSEIISSKEFLHSKDIHTLNMSLSSTADLITTQLFKSLKLQYTSNSIEILAMGKWGGKELGLKSDLDFIFICFEPPSPSDFKIARRFLSRLRDQHKGGTLYDVDLRLRPSGKAGPLIVKWDRLLNYIENEADPWELQTYLKARFIDSKLDTKLIEILKEAIFKYKITSEDLILLSSIKTQLNSKAKPSLIDIKYSPGGLIDIELGSQLSSLKHKIVSSKSSLYEIIDALISNNHSWQSAGLSIFNNYQQLRIWEQLYQLITSHTGTEIHWNSEFMPTYSLLLNCTPVNLQTEIQTLLDQNLILLKKVDPDYFSS